MNSQGMNPSGMSTPAGMNPSGMSAPTGMNPPGVSAPGMPSPMTTTKMMGGRRRMGKTKKGKKSMSMWGGAANKMPAVGSKASVYHGHAKHTSGGLTRKDLMKTKHGRIVSRKKHALGKKALKNLVKAGFKAKKGTFKLFRK